MKRAGGKQRGHRVSAGGRGRGVANSSGPRFQGTQGQSAATWLRASAGGGYLCQPVRPMQRPKETLTMSQHPNCKQDRRGTRMSPFNAKLLCGIQSRLEKGLLHLAAAN